MMFYPQCSTVADASDRQSDVSSQLSVDTAAACGNISSDLFACLCLDLLDT